MELSEIMKELKKMEALKSQAVEKLLAQRAEIDSQLADLGHGSGPAKRRKRRTKAEMEAANKK